MLIAGVDEVGRGPLAGPVVTAAVILNEPIQGVVDSKQLTAKRRSELAGLIKKQAIAYAYGRAEVHEINCLNIHHATLLAMKRAIEALIIYPEKVLVDGIHHPNVRFPTYAIVNGDDLIPEISAASILAKVHRDEEMEAMDVLYPGYGFASHKGYSTARHHRALEILGPCPIHRQHFNRVAACTNAL